MPQAVIDVWYTVIYPFEKIDLVGRLYSFAKKNKLLAIGHNLKNSAEL